MAAFLAWLAAWIAWLSCWPETDVQKYLSICPDLQWLQELGFMFDAILGYSGENSAESQIAEMRVESWESDWEYTSTWNNNTNSLK